MEKQEKLQNWLKARFARGVEHNMQHTLSLAYFQVFLLIIPVAIPFFESKGLSMQEIFSLQAVFAFVVLASEVPSGYFADVFGRRPALLVGAVFSGLGYTALQSADGFWGLVVFEAAVGLAHSLISGADLALLYDSERTLGRSEQEQRQVVGRLYAIRTFSETVAGLLCSVLLLWSMETLVLAQLIVGWLPLIFAVLIVEPPGERLAAENHGAQMLAILRCLFASGAVLRLAFLCLCIWSLTTFYAVWLLQKLWESGGIDVAYFGLLWAGLSLLAALAGRWAHRAEDTFGATTILLFVGAAPVFGYLGLVAFGPLGALLASTVFFVARGLGMVLLKDAFNRRLPGAYRATANSLAGFGFRAGFALTGTAVGYVVDAWSMATALWLLAAFSAIVCGALIVPLVVAVRGAERSCCSVPVERTV